MQVGVNTGLANGTRIPWPAALCSVPSFKWLSYTKENPEQNFDEKDYYNKKY